jgi:hypothetical protein
LRLERPEALSKVRIGMKCLGEREIRLTNLGAIRVRRDAEKLVVVQLARPMEGFDDVSLKLFVDLHIFNERGLGGRARRLGSHPLYGTQRDHPFD